MKIDEVKIEKYGPEALNLLREMLTNNPKQRITAA